MKIVEKRTYAASPAELWEIIREPSSMPAWNPKCVHSDPLAAYRVGERFAVTYEMNGRTVDAVGELHSYRNAEFIQYRYAYEDSSRIGTVDEVFEIIPKGNRSSMLIHTVDFSQSTLPGWVKFLIGIFGKIGKKQGTGPLDGIAAILDGTSG